MNNKNKGKEMNKENVTVKEEKQFTNDDIMIILEVLPEDEREILLDNYNFENLKNFIYNGYKSNMEIFDKYIQFYTLTKKAVQHLCIGAANTDTEENKVDRITRLYKSLDDNRKIKVSERIQNCDGLDVSIGKLKNTWNNSEAVKQILGAMSSICKANALSDAFSTVLDEKGEDEQQHN